MVVVSDTGEVGGEERQTGAHFIGDVHLDHTAPAAPVKQGGDGGDGALPHSLEEADVGALGDILPAVSPAQDARGGVGQGEVDAAVEAAVSGVTDKMVAFACTRTEDGGYRCDTKLLDLSSVANYEKKVPVEWINERGNDISDEFIRYALPLIQGETGMVKENGLPRFAKLKKVRA